MTKIMQYFIINKHKMTTNDNKYDNKSVVFIDRRLKLTLCYILLTR